MSPFAEKVTPKRRPINPLETACWSKAQCLGRRKRFCSWVFHRNSQNRSSDNYCAYWQRTYQVNLWIAGKAAIFINEERRFRAAGGGAALLRAAQPRNSRKFGYSAIVPTPRHFQQRTHFLVASPHTLFPPLHVGQVTLQEGFEYGDIIAANTAAATVRNL